MQTQTQSKTLIFAQFHSLSLCLTLSRSLSHTRGFWYSDLILGILVAAASHSFSSMFRIELDYNNFRPCPIVIAFMAYRAHPVQHLKAAPPAVKNNNKSQILQQNKRNTRRRRRRRATATATATTIGTSVHSKSLSRFESLETEFVAIRAASERT